MNKKRKKREKQDEANIVVLKNVGKEKESRETETKTEVEEKNEIQWEAPEYEFNLKEVSWYWLSVIVAIVLVFIAFWQRNFLFAIFVIIAELILIHFAGRFPIIWKFKLNKKGISIGEQKFYEFNQIECFDVHNYNEEFNQLIIKQKSKLSPYIKIFIHPEDEDKIKNLLLQYIPQRELEGSVIDSLERIIRF